MFFKQINLRNVLYLLKLNFAECDYTYIHIYFRNVSHFVIYIVHYQKGTQKTGWSRNKVYLYFEHHLSYVPPSGNKYYYKNVLLWAYQVCKIRVKSRSKIKI